MQFMQGNHRDEGSLTFTEISAAITEAMVVEIVRAKKGRGVLHSTVERQVLKRIGLTLDLDDRADRITSAHVYAVVYHRLLNAEGIAAAGRFDSFKWVG